MYGGYGKYSGPMPFKIGDRVVAPDSRIYKITQIDRHVYPIILHPPTRRYKPEDLKLIT